MFKPPTIGLAPTLEGAPPNSVGLYANVVDSKPIGSIISVFSESSTLSEASTCIKVIDPSASIPLSVALTVAEPSSVNVEITPSSSIVATASLEEV